MLAAVHGADPRKAELAALRAIRRALNAGDLARVRDVVLERERALEDEDARELDAS